MASLTYSVTNTAENTPGGTRFNTEIGAQYSVRTLAATTTFIWKIFQQNNLGDWRNLERFSLFIDDMGGISDVGNDQIHVSAGYIQGYSGNVKIEITGVLYHEMTRVLQWNANGSAPHSLITGIADFVRLKAGYVPSHWKKPGQGDQWDQGYEVTANFLDYCDGLGGGTFVAELNRRMKNEYSNSFFEELLGKSVDTLWADYKAQYNN